MVSVEWADAHGGNGSWTAVGDVEHEPRTVHTVGWLVKRDELGYTVAQSYDPGAEALDHTLFIPAAVVRSSRQLIVSNLRVVEEP